MLISGISAAGGQHSHDHSGLVIESIHQQVEDGAITYEEGLLQRFRLGFGWDDRITGDLQILDTRNISSGTSPYRCLTPLIAEFERNRDQLSPAAESEILEMISPDETEEPETYISPSGVFELLYFTEGDDAVDTTDTTGTGIPDYVERAGEIADSSYQVLVEENGFKDPRYDDNAVYPIYFKDLNEGVYGRTRSISSENTTEIEVRNSYEDFPDNDDPEGHEMGALKVTIAHEIQHAIQYQYTRWSGPSGDFEWIEMDAVMVEEVVFPYVNDYHNYLSSINSIFTRPHDGPPGAYWQATWFLYYYEKLGLDFWREVWQHLEEDSSRSVPEAKALSRNSEALQTDRIRNHIWHLSSGDRSIENYGFRDRDAYPEAMLTEDTEIPAGFRDEFTLADYDARYYRYQPDENSDGTFRIGLYADGNGLGVGLLAVTKDGDFEELIWPASEDQPDLIDTGWETSELEEVRVVLTGSREGGEGRYRFVVGAGEEIESVAYGDFDDSGEVNEDDVENLLQHVVSQQSNTASRLFRGDVSGDGELSAYDGSLILRHIDGTLGSFPVDESGTGFGPEASVFEPPEALASERVDPGSFPDVSWSLDLLTETPKTKKDLDLQLSMEVGEESIEEEFYALTFNLELPHWIEFQELKLKEPLDDAIAGTHRHVDTLYVAISGRNLFGEGPLLNMRFNPTEHNDSEITLLSARLDEFAGTPGSTGTGTFEIEENVAVDAKVDPELPQELVLKSNYPNPFNPVTTIGFKLPEPGNVRLVVYDINGRKVNTLVDQNLNAGTHEFNFDGSRLSSGMYIYRLYAPSAVKTGKMMLVK